MPFVPSRTTAHERQVFAERLAYHLASTQSRQSLMALQEGFARAGGFPNAHAAMVCWKKQSFFRRSQGSNETPEDMLLAFRFLGIGPAKLFQWAKQSHRKQAGLLSQPSFTVADSQTLLAALWGHRDWPAALAMEDLPKRKRGLKWLDFPSSLSTAPTLDALHEKAWEQTAWDSSPYGKAHPGLYCAWGQRKGDLHWVGQPWTRARNQTLVIADNETVRFRMVWDHIQQRLSKQHPVIALDASSHHSLSSALLKHAKQQGKRVQVIDWTVEGLNPSEVLAAKQVPEQDGRFVLEHPMVLWKLPSDGKNSLALQKQALILLKNYLLHTLNAEDASLTKPPTAIFNLDVPFSLHPPGMAATYAQARAQGFVCLSAQSTAMLNPGNEPQETAALVGNTNTKWVAGPRAPSDPLWSQLDLPPQQLDSNDAYLVCGGNAETMVVPEETTGF